MDPGSAEDRSRPAATLIGVWSAEGPNVGFGSEADVTLSNFDVRFTPESGHSPTRSGCLLWAISRQSALRQINVGVTADRDRRGYSRGYSVGRRVYDHTVPFCSEATALRFERGGLNFACEDLHFHIGARGCGGGFMP